MFKKNLSWAFAALRSRSRASGRLGVSRLEDRTTPSFTVTPLAGNLLLRFQGDAASDALTLSVSPDGYLRHNLIQPNLASEFDMNSAQSGEQRIFFFEPIRVTLAGGSGNDLLVNDTGIRSDLLGEFGNDTLVGGAADDRLVASSGADQYAGRGGTDLLDARTSGTGLTTVLLSDASLTVGAATTVDPQIESLRLFASNLPVRVDASGLTTGSVFVVGGSGSDTIWGGAHSDDITGNGGDDSLTGGGGNDTIEAGAGNDSVDGGAGNDRLFGNQGSDLVTGGDGNDVVQGDLPAGFVTLGAGDDTVAGGAGDDAVDGGMGDDQVSGGAGFDLLFERNSHRFRLTDTELEMDGVVTHDHGFEAAGVTGTAGDDVLDAGGLTAGPVTLLGLAGNDTLVGGSGNDLLTDGDGANVIYGGDGNDQVSTLPSGVPVVAGNWIDAGAGDDRVTAGAGNDTIWGGAGNDDLDAGVGADLADGGAGVDAVLGASGPDTLAGGAGNDLLFGDFSRNNQGFEPGADHLSGGDGDDVVDAGLGDDRPEGGAGTDRLVDTGVRRLLLTDTDLELGDWLIPGHGFEAANLTGTAGDDRLHAADFTLGPVTMLGAGGSDLLWGGEGNDNIQNTPSATGSSLRGGAGNDTILGGGGADEIWAGPGDDRVTAFAGPDEVRGGPGDDTLDAGAGDDTVEGGSGDDRLDGGDGVDELDGGSGDDTVLGGVADRLNGGTEYDHLSLAAAGATVVLTDTDLTVDGAVALDHLSFESVELSGDTGANVLDSTGFTGSVSLNGDGGDDTLRMGPGPAVVSGGDGADVLTVVGTDGADVFVIGPQTVEVNGAVVEYTGAEALAIDAGAGVDAASFLSGPIDLPVTATGLEPTVSAGGDETLPAGPFTRAGSVTDIRAGQTWTATADFGDGSGAEPLTLNPDGTFTLSHTYAEPGEYRVTVVVTDGEGNVGLAEFLVLVTAL